MKSGRVVIIPARHVLISKIKLKSLEDHISRQQKELNAVANANLVLQESISRQQTATDVVKGMKHVCLHDLGTDSKSRSLNQQEMLLTTAALVVRSLHTVGRDAKEINTLLG